MLIQVPPEIDQYIKMHYYNILIPKLGLPDNLKDNSTNLTTNNISQYGATIMILSTQ